MPMGTDAHISGANMLVFHMLEVDTWFDIPQTPCLGRKLDADRAIFFTKRASTRINGYVNVVTMDAEAEVIHVRDADAREKLRQFESPFSSGEGF